MAVKLLTRQQAVAALGGMPERTFARLVSEGIPRRGDGAKARFPWPDAWHWYLDRERKAAKEAARPPVPADLADAERRLEAARAETAEIKLAQLRGDLVTVKSYREELGRTCEQLRGIVLAIPGRYAHRLVGLATPAQAMAQLRMMAHDLVIELQRDPAEDEAA